ncbi:MAG: patatin-like phospholipase family protein [Holosporaceae bacterium]|nr:patatin-like phospholipase family protein [Holosporaceae bacterium]
MKNSKKTIFRFFISLLFVFSCSAMRPPIVLKTGESSQQQRLCLQTKPIMPDVPQISRSSSSDTLLVRTAQPAQITAQSSAPIFWVERPLLPIYHQETKIIFSIDGGGSRGIIPLFYTMELMKRLRIPSLGPLVDMFAGTSVGALICAGIALGQEASMFENFHSLVERTFSKSKLSMKGVCKPLYKNSEKLKVIKEFTGERSARELGVDFIVPFFCYNTGEAMYYKSFSPSSEDFKLADLLMMTSSAPTFFNPYFCFSSDLKKYEGGDGGIFANHPGEEAYHLARSRYPFAKLVMISFGTGTCDKSAEFKYYENRGLIFWAERLPHLFIAAATDNTERSLVNLSQKDSNFHYHRIQLPLRSGNMSLDENSPEKLDLLISAAMANIGPTGFAYNPFSSALSALQQKMQG